jgi:hypothetical protein
VEAGIEPLPTIRDAVIRKYVALGTDMSSCEGKIIFVGRQ